MRGILSYSISLGRGRGTALAVACILVVLACILLPLGIFFASETQQHLKQRVEYLNAPHFISFQPAGAPVGEQMALLEYFPAATTIESQDVIFTRGNYSVDGELRWMSFVIAEGNTGQGPPMPRLMGQPLPFINDALYLPQILADESGLSVGDYIDLNFMGQSVDFLIAGITEEVYLGSYQVPIWRLFVPSDRFAELAEQVHEYSLGVLHFVTLENAAYATYLSERYVEAFSAPDFQSPLMPLNFPLSIDALISLQMTVPAIIFSALILMGLALLALSGLVFGYLSRSVLHETIKGSGMLKSMGYSNAQIKMSYALCLMQPLIFSVVLGLSLSALLLPLLVRVFEDLLLISWNPTMSLQILVLVFVAVILAFAVLLLLVIRNVSRLTALRALQGQADSGKSTPRRRWGNRDKVVTGRMLVQRGVAKIKVAIMVSAVVVFFSAYFITILVAANLALDENSDELAILLRGEGFGDVGLIVSDPHEVPNFMQRLEAWPEVEGVYSIHAGRILSGDTTLLFEAYDSFDRVSAGTIIEGRFPQGYDEVVLNTLAASSLDKDVGDWVTLEGTYGEQSFLVVGINQHLRMFGDVALLTTQGVSQVTDLMDSLNILVILQRPADAALVLEAILQQEGQIVVASDLFSHAGEDLLEGAASNIRIASGLVVLGLIAVISLSVFWVSNESIRRNRANTSTFKALGFEGGQLMWYLVSSLAPPALIALAGGIILGVASFNHLLARGLQAVGIIQVSIVLSVIWIAVVGLLVAIVTAVTMMSSARKIEDISPLF